MADLSIRNVIKVYPNGFPALHGIDAHVEDGELLVLVGPSGCGKSTPLRMIAGLEGITSGEIAIADRVVNRLEPAERDIAMVFQNYALYPHMSVRQNMAYGLKVRGTPRREIAERVQKAAETLELSQLLDCKPRMLSGGQRQRVAMGRAIVREPQVFLFDEPLSNLDAKLRVQMRIEIKRLQQRLGVTSIYVTHDQVEAMTLGHRLVVMNEGRAEQIGTPMELYNKPQTVFVAGFIGSPAMNLVEGVLEGDGIRLGAETLVPLPATATTRALKAEAVLGIRPEHFELTDPGNALLTIETELIEALGADTLVHGHAGDVALTLRLPGSHPVAMGEHLPVTVAPGHFHVFDRVDGQRVGD
jgi:sn-glycerol 3-phosphate transport system ATP-binding protein